MSANSICVDQLKNVRLFLSLFTEPIAAEETRIVIFGPSKRRIIYGEIVEDLAVEIVLTDEQFVDVLEEQAAFGALDHAVIICVCQSDRLADSELAQRTGRHRLILRRIFDRTGRDDRALSGHQSRIR